MRPREFIEENVGLVDRLVERACRRVGIAAAEIDDMASMVKVALVENDYAILRRYEGRSSIATYLAIVIQRLLADDCERTRGRWRPSAEAQRLGQRAVVIEDVVQRQGRSVEEALPFVRAVDPGATRDDVAALAAKLPVRAPRPREVPLEDPVAAVLSAGESTDRHTHERELRDVARGAGALLRQTMEAWPAEDRLLVRLRFESSMSIADIARLLAVPQRPLYRRLEALLARLRGVLTGAGIDPATAGQLLAAAPRAEIDFGVVWKNDDAPRTPDEAERGSAGEDAW